MPTESRRAERRRRRYGCGVTALLMAVALVLGVYGVGSHLLPGIMPELCRVTVGKKTESYTPDQMANAATIASVGVRRRLPQRAVTIALATVIQESKLRNLDHGDRDSLGLFQQRPSQGWGTPQQLRDPVYATEAFYDHLVEVEDYLKRPLTDVAQEVQRSGFPEAYARHEEQADHLARAMTGRVPAAVSCRLSPGGPSAPPSSLIKDMHEELGITPARSDDGVRAVLSSQDLAWAAGAWAVAHADRAGIRSVRVGDRIWSRSHRTASPWEDSSEGSPTEVIVSTR